MSALYLMQLGNRLLSVICGSMGIFCLWESFAAGSIAAYAVVFFIMGTALEAGGSHNDSSHRR
jgi:hypothetical protein